MNFMKAFVIGLDGATFEILTPLMQAGYLPNLQKAFSQGASGELLSTIPPVTALAWSSFITGKNPGKHGLLSWQGRLNARFERPWVSGKVIRGTKLWHLAGEAGLRACVVNVPVTKHVHRMWAETPPAERDRLSKRNYYRFLERFRDRFDLLVEPGPPRP